MRKAPVFWFTGLSGSGKTTIAEKAFAELLKQSKSVKIYDGDIIRKQITTHLTFTAEHINHNNKIVAKLCAKERERYDYIFVSLISPFPECRMVARKTIGDLFYLIYVKASLGEVIERDPKGLYKKALSGKIKNFIGISKNAPYKPPRDADLVLDTEKESAELCTTRLMKFIKSVKARKKTKGLKSEKGAFDRD